MRNKTLVLLIFIILLATQVNAFAAPSSWHLNEVREAQLFELIPEGFTDNYQESITRLEFAKLVVKVYEGKKGTITDIKDANPFIDTKDVDVLKAYSLDVVKGVGNSLFAPDNAITRQEIAVMFHRLLEKLDMPLESSTSLVFKDDKEIADWAKASVYYSAQIGIIKGTGDNQFSPKGNTTVEQAIALSLRAYKEVLNNNSSDGLISPPKNIFAKVEGSDVILLKWDNTSADYFTIMQKINHSNNWSELTNPKTGINKWLWEKDVIAVATGYTPGDRVVFAVNASKDNILSDYGFSNDVIIPGVMPTENVESILRWTHPWIEANSIKIVISDYVVSSGENRPVNVVAYMDIKGFSSYMQSEQISMKSIAKASKVIASDIKQLTNKEVIMTLVYSGSVPSEPKALKNNFIYPYDTVVFNASQNNWTVWYPAMEVKTDSTTFRTWSGEYNY